MSLCFGALIYIRNMTYDMGARTPRRLPGVVCSVGNIGVGGTGKTPVVIALVLKLAKFGFSPAILTRGYGSSLKKNEWVVFQDGLIVGGNADPSHPPDEARLQSEECPGVFVVAGANRIAAAHAFLGTMSNIQAPSHWVLDDGFQHRQIYRDIDIVLIDKVNPVGNGWLLPFGFLREPLENIKRASHVFLTGNGAIAGDIFDKISKVSLSIDVTEISYRSLRLDLDIRGEIKFSDIDSANLLLVACVARPERILQDLKHDGIVPAREIFLPDHQVIDPNNLVKVSAGVSGIITTAKDYWRNPDVFASIKIPVFIKKIEFILPDSLVSGLFERK